MSAITISYTEQVTNTKTVNLPAYVKSNNDYYKIIAVDAFIQVSTDNGLTIKKWENNTASVRRLLTDPNYSACTPEDFATLYTTVKDLISDLVE